MQPVTDRPASSSPKGAGPPEVDPIVRAVQDFQSCRDREGSFRVLVEAFMPVVERYFARRVPRHQDRDDLTQETFLRIYQGIEGFRGDSSFGTWVFSIARNTCLQWRRHRHARPESSLQTLVPRVLRQDSEPIEPDIPDREQDQPLEVVLDEERRRALREAIAELPPQMRRAMVLRVVHGCKYREVAELMHLSIDTVKAHLFQARTRVGERLGERFGDIDF